MATGGARREDRLHHFVKLNRRRLQTSVLRLFVRRPICDPLPDCLYLGIGQLELNAAALCAVTYSGLSWHP